MTENVVQWLPSHSTRQFAARAPIHVAHDASGHFGADKTYAMYSTG